MVQCLKQQQNNEKRERKMERIQKVCTSEGYEGGQAHTYSTGYCLAARQTVAQKLTVQCKW